MQREPVEQGHVQSKPRTGAPPGQRFGVRGHEQTGRRQPVPADAGLEALPHGGVKHRAQAHSPGRIKFRGLLRQRELRRGRQIIQPFFPVASSASFIEERGKNH